MNRTPSESSIMAEQSDVIEVKYFRMEGEVLMPPKEFIIQVDDKTLLETISKAIPEEMQDESDLDFRCFPGDFQRKSINLQQRPRQIQYILDAIKIGTNPVLYVCKESTASSSGVSSSSSSSDSLSLLLPMPFARKPSFVIQNFMIESDRLSLASTEYDEEVATMEFGFQRNRDSVSSTGSGISTIMEVTNRSSATLPQNALSSAMSENKFRTIKARDRQAKSNGRPKSMFPQRGNLMKRISNPELFEEACATTSHEHEFQKSESEAKLRPTVPIATKQRLAKRSSVITFDISGPQLPDPSEIMTVTWHQDRRWDRKRNKAMKRRYTMSFDKLEEVRVETENGSTMLIPCTDFTTIGDLKNTAIAEYLKLCGNLSLGSDTSRQFILTYSYKRKEYEMLNEAQFIWKTRYYDQFAEGKTVVPVKLQVVKQRPEHELRFLYRISQLTGVMLDDSLTSFGGTDHLARIDSADQAEVQWTRRSLHDFVTEVASSRDPEQYSLSMELVSGELPVILDLKVPTDNKVEITFHYKHSFSLTKRISVNQYADNILAEVFTSIVSCGLVRDKIEEYTLQFTGEESYIHGENTLLAFKDIRKCITKGEPIHLSITEKPSPELDMAHEFSWLPLELCSHEIPQHIEITPTDRTGVSSVWDHPKEENFSFVLKKVENVPFSSSSKLSVIVKATIYHGGKALHLHPYTATARNTDGKVFLSERAECGIQKRNLPKAAKIMIEVREGTGRRESAVATPKFLYWGLFPVFNHRGILCSGEQVIRLWQGRKPENGKKGRTREGHDTVVLEPNPCAPPANNPHPRAVKITIIFDTPAVPVMYPSTSPSSCASFLKMHPVMRNTATKGQFRQLLKLVKEKGLYSKLPDYIAGVDWGNLSECLEVYSFLDNLMDVIDTIPVEVALRQLDADFPDETVREFALLILENLPDDQLEGFLLQLTQAVKFESHHDSALARFLLKRALTNKRIGHFFFWYLKCEMYNPQYMARFGVILEAYLKGCGEAMLARFLDQTEIQNNLEKIAAKLKDECRSDYSKMQGALPGMLKREGIQKFTFTPVYNPRIQLGKLLPTKCKIMPSAKKPFWLELQNVHPTVLRPTPTRLILKLGDDLRQDMITLRILSLFEKLWEEQGLDLELIPYGCMATGPKTGFIEVVKNAKTIAEVSEVRSNKKLLEWITSHQINEFGEIDQDKVIAAVKRFTHSCAGYSVATYILGIGDRHNENIMVTTSGNLFHIDFGHFLGHIKYCMGFKREWAPFVLTPDFVYVMGGEGSEMFEMYKNLCCRAFLVLRRHAELIINLFSMMRSTGIPELSCVEDTDYIRMALALDRSEHNAQETFRNVIKKCLDLKWTVQVMWKIHLVKKNLLTSGSSS